MDEELKKSSEETQEVHQQLLSAKQALTQNILNATTPLGGPPNDEPVLPKGFIELFDLEDRINVLINVNTIARVRPYGDKTLVLLNVYNPNRVGYTFTTTIPYDKVKTLIAEAL